MIPALLLWLLKRYAPGRLEQIGMLTGSLTCISAIRSLSLTVALLLLSGFRSPGDEVRMSYLISKGGNTIGRLEFTKTSRASETFFRMSSVVDTRFLFRIRVLTEDESHFLNGRLISSSVRRKVNEGTGENRRTLLSGEGYRLDPGVNTRTLTLPISYNMMMLYTKEPGQASMVYSDNFQQFVPIKVVSEHIYRIDLPDGSYNFYHFRNGICNIVEVHHNLYTIKMKLIQ